MVTSRILGLLASLFIFQSGISASYGFSGSGNGSSGNPYVITNAIQLQEMADRLNAHYVLGNDIDASATVTWNGGEGFKPIGDQSNEFTGSFNGQGFSILNLTINRPAERAALFGVASGATLENVTFEGGTIAGGPAGALVSFAEEFTSICNVNSSAAIYGYSSHCGGIAGFVENSEILNCHCSGTVVMKARSWKVGGLVGSIGASFGRPKSRLIDCSALGKVSEGGFSASEVGGLVGFASEVDITRCFATGSVTGTEDVGGLIGRITWESFPVVEECFATGTVFGINEIGGFIGSVYEASITNCFATGSVLCKKRGAGFIGLAVDCAITSCFSSGLVHLRSPNIIASLGGFIGGQTDSTITDCYWDLDTSDQSSSASTETGKAHSEMLDSSTYNSSSWDFVGTWEQSSGVSYPSLRSLPLSSSITLNLQISGQGRIVMTDLAGTTITDFDDSSGPVEIAWNSLKPFRLSAHGDGFANWRGDGLPIEEGVGLNGFTFCVDRNSSLTAGFLSASIPISTIEQLQMIGNHVDLPRSWSYYLPGDLDASETSNWSQGLGFKPIGSWNRRFTGTFDGRGFRVSELTINRPDEHGVGLFGHIEGSVLKNLTVANASVQGGTRVGTLVGYSLNSEVDDCSSSGVVIGTSTVGGLIAHFDSNSLGRRLQSETTVLGGGYYTGGLIGNLAASSLTDSSAEGDVTGGNYVGGLVGGMHVSTNVLTTSSATGNVSGVEAVGGLVGAGSSGNIFDSFASGDVSGDKDVGGFIGYAGYHEIERAFSTGVVTGETDTGGFAGRLSSTPVRSIFWDTETSGLSTSAGSSASGGRTTSEMMVQTTFSGFDFDSIWAMKSGGSYPYFRQISISHQSASLTDGSSAINLGDVVLGDSSPVFTFVVENTAAVELTGLAVTKDGANTADFAISGLGATTLAPGASTSFSVTFTPGATGLRTAAIRIISNETDEDPFEITLSGTGVIQEIAVEQPAGVDLTDGVSTIDFGTQLLEANPVLEVTIRNVGTSPLTGLSADVIGPQAGVFTVDATAATALDPGESTTFSLTFHPALVGAYSASLRIASNDPDENPFDIGLSGVGVTPEIEVSLDGNDLTNGSASADFGVVLNSEGSKDLTFTIRNIGDAPLTGLSVSFSGPHSADFSAESLGSTLAPAASVSLTVTLAPSAFGDRTATLHLASSDLDENPFDISLRGSSIERTTLRGWGESFGLAGEELLSTADDDGDFISLLEEYAFNLDPTVSDLSVLASGAGTGGLPLIHLVGSGAAKHLQAEFVRRRGDPDLTYTVEFGSHPSELPPDGFLAADQPEMITGIDLEFERVIVDDSRTVGTDPRRFGRVKLEYAEEAE